MSRIFLVITATLLSFAGAAAWLLTLDDPVWLGPVLTTALGLLTLVAVVIETKSFLALRPKRYRSQGSINRFMSDWIGSEGRVAIFTRDMSWVEGPIRRTLGERLFRSQRLPGPSPIKALLLRKAKAGDLVICLPRAIALTDELEQAGATIHTYEALAVEPTSRFTIVRHGRQDAVVAVGRRLRGVHQIETFGVGEHPTFAMADDLVTFVSRLERGP